MATKRIAAPKTTKKAPAKNTKTLPGWNLKDLYASPTAPQIKTDIATCRKQAASFAKQYAKKIATLPAPALHKAIQHYEKMDELMAKLYSYAYLYYAENVTDPKRTQFQQSIMEQCNDISTNLIFFTLEINTASDKQFKKWAADKALAHYLPWLQAVRQFRDHQLSDDMETLLHERSVVGRAAWNRLFDQTIADLKFDLDGKMVEISAVSNQMSSADPKKRKSAALALGAGLSTQIKTLALITNTLAKDKEIDDKWRQYPRATSARNLANQVEDHVVDALVKSVRTSFPQLSHRYYKLKAKWFGVKQMPYWDRNAPLPGKIDRVIPWGEARNIVLDAYTEFSPKLGAIGQQFFDKNWIDVPPRPGKDSGAFAHPTVPSVHPYLMLNYHGKVRDVMTLAHELGHGVHQYLAGRRQGHLLADTPLTLAETASVFGEMLTFQSLLRQTTNKKDRKILLAGKVEDMLNTVVRQIAFFTFEERVHAARRKGELTPQHLGEIWMSIQGESLGPAIKFDKNYETFWSYIPHFIHTPFYVYAYAFGDCLVNALYAEYQNKPAGFADKYLELLASGGRLHHSELLKPFGLNAADPKFWNKGLALISSLIDELETL